MGNTASGDINISKMNNDDDKVKNNDNKDKEEVKEEVKEVKKCKMPSKNNPAMNYLNTDFNTDRDYLEACKLTPKVDKKMRKIINSGVGKNLNSMDKRMNERQFITMPWTTQINDQTAFANWLYKDLNKCKSDHINCGKNAIGGRIYLYDKNY